MEGVERELSPAPPSSGVSVTRAAKLASFDETPDADLTRPASNRVGCRVSDDGNAIEVVGGADVLAAGLRPIDPGEAEDVEMPFALHPGLRDLEDVGAGVAAHVDTPGRAGPKTARLDDVLEVAGSVRTLRRQGIEHRVVRPLIEEGAVRVRRHPLAQHYEVQGSGSGQGFIGGLGVHADLPARRWCRRRQHVHAVDVEADIRDASRVDDTVVGDAPLLGRSCDQHPGDGLLESDDHVAPKAGRPRAHVVEFHPVGDDDALARMLHRLLEEQHHRLRQTGLAVHARCVGNRRRTTRVRLVGAIVDPVRFRMGEPRRASPSEDEQREGDEDLLHLCVPCCAAPGWGGRFNVLGSLRNLRREALGCSDLSSNEH